jgi:hypothetical protein
MPIEVNFDPRHLHLVLSVGSKSLLPGRRGDQTVDKLFEAIQIIRDRMGDKKIYYLCLDICSNHRKGEEFTAWTKPAVASWVRIARDRRLRERLKQWLTELEKLLIEANSSAGRSTGGLWEGEETQLGEVAASAFAAADVTFVSFYARLLKVWDTSHEVMQGDTIDSIIENHGICAETEELLYARAVETGYGVDQIGGLFPILQEHYGDFTKSSLFRKIVETLHARDRAWRVKEHEKFVELLARNPKAKPNVLSERNLFVYWRNIPQLKQAADRLLEELDTTAGPLPSVH